MNSGTQGHDSSGTDRRPSLVERRLRIEQPGRPTVSAPPACKVCVQKLKKQKQKETYPAEYKCVCEMCHTRHLCYNHAYPCSVCDAYTCKNHREDHWSNAHEEEYGEYESSDEDEDVEADLAARLAALKESDSNIQDGTEWTDEQWRAWQNEDDHVQNQSGND